MFNNALNWIGFFYDIFNNYWSSIGVSHLVDSRQSIIVAVTYRSMCGLKFSKISKTFCFDKCLACACECVLDILPIHQTLKSFSIKQSEFRKHAEIEIEMKNVYHKQPFGLSAHWHNHFRSFVWSSLNSRSDKLIYIRRKCVEMAKKQNVDTRERSITWRSLLLRELWSNTEFLIQI